MVMALRTFQIAFSMGFQKWILSNFLLKQFVKKNVLGLYYQEQICIN